MDSAFSNFANTNFVRVKKFCNVILTPPGVVWFLYFKPKKVHNSENRFFLFVFFNCYQNKPNRQRLSISTGAVVGMVLYGPIIPLLADFYKPKRADLLRQFFNFWTNSGNLAKISKRRFRDKLRAHDQPVAVLVYHIAIFSLKITWFRNESIFHCITSIYLLFANWQKSAAGLRTLPTA